VIFTKEGGFEGWGESGDEGGRMRRVGFSKISASRLLWLVPCAWVGALAKVAAARHGSRVSQVLPMLTIAE
jgi:hypothetical protein